MREREKIKKGKIRTEKQKQALVPTFSKRQAGVASVTEQKTVPVRYLPQSSILMEKMLLRTLKTLKHQVLSIHFHLFFLF